jgi:hypothetical protein
MSFLDPPKQQPAPTPDPATTALFNQQQARAEADRVRATQQQLDVETRIRGQSFGLRSLLGPLGGGSLRSFLGSG